MMGKSTFSGMMKKQSPEDAKKHMEQEIQDANGELAVIKQIIEF